MRYKDVSKPLYEAVRYGNREKSYVLSNLNKFNFGVELEFDLPKADDQIEILDPYIAVGECLISTTSLTIAKNIDNPLFQNYPDYNLSEMQDSLRNLSWVARDALVTNTNEYDITRIRENIPEFFEYIVNCVRDILRGENPRMYGIWLTLLFPVSSFQHIGPVATNSLFENVRFIFDRQELLYILMNKDSVSEVVLGHLRNFIKYVKRIVDIMLNFPPEQKLEELKRGTSLSTRKSRVINYIAGKLVEGVPNTEENPFDIFACLYVFSIRTDAIRKELHRIAEKYPDVVRIKTNPSISLDSAKSDKDIMSLSTKFDIIPEGTNQIEFISPTCTGQEITQCFSDIKALTDIVIDKNGTTSNRTGLHLSISYNGDTSNFNALKFLLFSDSYRQIVKPEHVRNYVLSISDDLFKIAMDHVISEMVYNNNSLENTLSAIEESVSKDKYMSVNLGVMDSSNGRIEIRWPGGEGYEHRLDDYIDSAIRAMHALEIAYNPGAFRKEYLLSIFRILDGLFKERLKCDLLSMIGFLRRIRRLVSGIHIDLVGYNIVFRNSRHTFSYYVGSNFSNLKTIEKEIWMTYKEKTDEI